MKEIKHMLAMFVRCILRKEQGIAGITAEHGFNPCGFVIYKYFHFHLLLGKGYCLQALIASEK